MCVLLDGSFELIIYCKFQSSTITFHEALYMSNQRTTSLLCILNLYFDQSKSTENYKQPSTANTYFIYMCCAALLMHTVFPFRHMYFHMQHTSSLLTLSPRTLSHPHSSHSPHTLSYPQPISHHPLTSSPPIPSPPPLFIPSPSHTSPSHPLPSSSPPLLTPSPPHPLTGCTIQSLHVWHNPGGRDGATECQVPRPHPSLGH